jgi:protein phosphatase
LVNWVVKKVNRVLDVTDDFLDAFTPAEKTQKTTSPTQTPPDSSDPHQAATVRLSQSLTPKQPGSIISYYKVLDTYALGRSNYYKVYGIRCQACKRENPNNKNLVCNHCQQPLRRFVLRESIPHAVLAESDRKVIIDLSEKIQGVLKHHLIFYLGGVQYILLDGFPEPWFSLGKGGMLPVQESEKAVAWIGQLGQAFEHLHKFGYFFSTQNKLANGLESLVVLKNQHIYLADITSSSPLGSRSNQARQRDIRYLAKVLYALVNRSGARGSSGRGSLDGVPTGFKNVLEEASQDRYTTIDDFLAALRKKPSRDLDVVRSLRQLVGYGTDVGKQRDHNEDYVSKFSLGLEQIPGTPEVGLYIVADGMGGHQAGEKASESVIKDVVINRIQEQLQKLMAVPKLKRATIKLDDVLTPGEILREAIEQANRVLLKARDASQGHDRGTTITAALVIGETCAVANVGDSRTYLLRANKLEQITQDHSLVAGLVASNMIQPSEVRSHPQRNQIYRTLGDKPKIEVDIFQRVLEAGDQLLLCSDGLWEMVLDDAIAKILQNARTPQFACDRLIEAANAAGGEDNISVIVVWLE